MKKIVSLFILVAAFASCGEEIKFNNPAFQATKNGNIWQANEMQAFGDDGGLTLIGAVGTDVVTLHTISANRGTYLIGSNFNNMAVYQSVDGEGDSYEAVSGEIKITASQDGTVTGTFEFIAKNAEGEEVTFTDGVFYKIPR